MPRPYILIPMLLFAAILLAAGGLGWATFGDAGFLSLEAAAEAEPGAGPVGASGLPLPRFASLGASEVNLRTGPGLRYPVAWVFTRIGLPVVITAEFGHWRRIHDRDGAEGWVHKILLSGRRFAIVTDGPAVLREAPSARARPVLRAEAGVLGRLLGCGALWCEMEIANVGGWIERRRIFGVLKAERFD